MTDSHNPVLGKDIPWKAVEEYIFRVRNFTPLATVKGDEIHPAGSNMPYAILSVECLELDKELTLHVNHKIDFLHLWKAFHERGILDGEEVLIGDFASKRRGFARMFGPFLPRLFIWICRKGHLERLVNKDWGDLTGEAWGEAVMPLEIWEPQT